MANRKSDPVEQLKALRGLAEDDLLDPEHPEALIDEELRWAGGDPDAIGSQGQAFVASLVKKGRAASKTRLRVPTKTVSSTPPGSEKASDGSVDDPE